MKTKEKTEKSLIQELREIRDKISSEIKDLSYEDMRQYLDKQKTLHQNVNWHSSR